MRRTIPKTFTLFSNLAATPDFKIHWREFMIHATATAKITGMDPHRHKNANLTAAICELSEAPLPDTDSSNDPIYRGTHLHEVLGDSSLAVFHPAGMRKKGADHLLTLLSEDVDPTKLSTTNILKLHGQHVTGGLNGDGELNTARLNSLSRSLSAAINFATSSLRSPTYTGLLSQLMGEAPKLTHPERWRACHNAAVVTSYDRGSYTNAVAYVPEEYGPHCFQYQSEVTAFFLRRTALREFVLLKPTETAEYCDISKIRAFQSSAYLPIHLALKTQGGRDLIDDMRAQQLKLEINRTLAWSKYTQAVKSGKASSNCVDLHDTFLACHQAVLQNELKVLHAINIFVCTDPSLGTEHLLKPERLSDAKQADWSVIAQQTVRHLACDDLERDGAQMHFNSDRSMTLEAKEADSETVHTLTWSAHDIRLALAPVVYATSGGSISSIFDPSNETERLMQAYAIASIAERLQASTPTVTLQLRDREDDDHQLTRRSLRT